MRNKAYNVALLVISHAVSGQAIAQDETYIRAGQLIDVVDGDLWNIRVTCVALCTSSKTACKFADP
jgi:hypothetical protein